MEKYRKDDQHYIEDYDRSTISQLKQLEAECISRGIKLREKTNFPEFVLQTEESYIPFTVFYEKAVMLAQIKNDVIAKWKLDDEKRDRLVAQYPIPQDVKCNICNSVMLTNTCLFKENNTLLLFVFNCPNGHTPHKVVYPNGREFFIPKATCKKCGGELKFTTKKKKDVTFYKDECKTCDHVISWEMDLTPEKPIDETERKRYCTDFIKSKSFIESLEDIGRLGMQLEEAQREREIKEVYDIEKIEKLTIPQVEQRLFKLTEELGYIKFQFEKPDMGKHVIVEFSVQDATDRSQKESEKVLQKSISENLFLTSWRLQKQSVLYRLGYITGKLRAYTDDEGLIRIAKEIKGVK